MNKIHSPGEIANKMLRPGVIETDPAAWRKTKDHLSIALLYLFLLFFLYFEVFCHIFPNFCAERYFSLFWSNFQLPRKYVVEKCRENWAKISPSRISLLGPKQAFFPELIVVDKRKDSKTISLYVWNYHNAVIFKKIGVKMVLHCNTFRYSGLLGPN